MKIEVEVRVFNHVMRERRRELGFTQAALRDMSGVDVSWIGKIERLQTLPVGKNPYENIGKMRDKLQRIADALEMPFRDLFPEEYLEMVRKELLPRSTRYQWVRDFSLDALPAVKYPALMDTPNLSEEVELEELAETMNDAVEARLTDREKRVIELRFGLNGERQHTLEEVAALIPGLGPQHLMTRERIRQIEAKAIRKLRHPIVRHKLETYLHPDAHDNEEELPPYG